MKENQEISERYSIGELSELTGLSRRTIHYYVQRGLLPPPEGGGRGHYYTPGHVERIRRIRAWQEEGRSLEEIGAALNHGVEDWSTVAQPPRPDWRQPGPVLWMRLPVAPGVELGIQAGRFRISPARLEKLADAVAELCGEIIPPLAGGEEGGSDNGSNDD
jgi:DNA-binding transcriptional MerR regulator